MKGTNYFSVALLLSVSAAFSASADNSAATSIYRSRSGGSQMVVVAAPKTTSDTLDGTRARFNNENSLERKSTKRTVYASRSGGSSMVQKIEMGEDGIKNSAK